MVKLWEVPAEELLALGDVGVLPWLPLSKFEGEPEPLLRRCRDRIDQEGGPQREQLLVVSQILTRLRFDRPDLLAIYGGRGSMIRSPLIKEIVEEVRQETRQTDILRVIQGRFGSVSPEIEMDLRRVTHKEALNVLLDVAIGCADVQAFAERVHQHIRPPSKPSSRRKKK